MKSLVFVLAVIGFLSLIAWASYYTETYEYNLCMQAYHNYNFCKYDVYKNDNNDNNVPVVMHIGSD